jgi:sigma-E factor negative regulatory protein RseA
MNEELDSQLSAMFDDELPSAECELLARRLSRDEPLKARWGRYAVIGAAIRSERGVRLNAALAGRVSKLLLAEPELAATAAPHAARRGALRWWQPLAGVGLAAGVAAVSILWLRTETPAQLASAPLPAPARALPGALAANVAGPAQSYVVPQTPAVRAMVVPSTEFANYVVAHSVYSAPVARRNLLSAFMTNESEAANEPVTNTAAQPPGNAQVNVR